MIVARLTGATVTPVMPLPAQRAAADQRSRAIGCRLVRADDVGAARLADHEIVGQAIAVEDAAVRSAEVTRRSRGAGVDPIAIVAVFEAVFECVLFDIGLHPDCKLIAVTILERLQAEALPYEIAVNGTTYAVNESEVKTGEGDTSVDRSEHLSVAQDREVVGDQFRPGQLVQGNSVGSLQVGPKTNSPINLGEKVEFNRTV